MKRGKVSDRVLVGKADIGTEPKLTRNTNENIKANTNRGNEARRIVTLVLPIGTKVDETLNRALINR